MEMVQKSYHGTIEEATMISSSIARGGAKTANLSSSELGREWRTSRRNALETAPRLIPYSRKDLVHNRIAVSEMECIQRTLSLDKEDQPLAAVRKQSLEGVVAKRRSSTYRSGDRSADWVKVRANLRQEFVIGGYVPGSNGFDSILVGCYDGRNLMYAARIRAGFVAASRRALFSKFDGFAIDECPFRNLPERTKGRWGEGLTAKEMKKCRWLRPNLVAAIEFLQWTPESRLRHPKFVGLRDDVEAAHVIRES